MRRTKAGVSQSSGSAEAGKVMRLRTSGMKLGALEAWSAALCAAAPRRTTERQAASTVLRRGDHWTLASRDTPERHSFAADQAFHGRRGDEDADLVVRWAELPAALAGRSVAHLGKRVGPTVECCHDVGAVTRLHRG